MEELKKCPFCGGKAKLKNVLGGEKWVVECNVFTCAVMPSTWFCKTKEEAIEAWNRRVEE